MLTKDEIRERLAASVSAILGAETEIAGTDNLLTLGLESLPTMRLLAGWIKQGYRVSFGSFMRRPTLAEWVQLLVEASPGEPADGSAEGMAMAFAQSGPQDPADAGIGQGAEPPEAAGARSDAEPFDLTDVQYAYWIGRRQGQYMGGVGCHGYVEVETGWLDPARLEASWETLLRAHPMLRACYTDDGRQYVRAEPADASVAIHDLTGLGADEQQAALLEMREALSHRLLAIDEGQVCCLQLSLLDENRALLHFDIDLLVCDVQSFQIILRDLAHHYATGEAPRTDPEWSFADYLETRAREGAEDVERDRQYWLARIDELPSGPRLPLRRGGKPAAAPRFVRRCHSFDRSSWRALRTACERHGTTPAMVLLTAYARTIGQWSEEKRFLMSVPLFNRDSDPAIEDVVADFTTLTLTDVDLSSRRSFVEDLRAIQESFYEDVVHCGYSAVRVLRDLRARRGEQFLAPVVFSCNLGEPLVNEEFVETFGEIGYMISQTPQVWIDLQVFNTIDGFTLICDAVEQIFPEGLLDEIVDCLVRETEQAIASQLGSAGPVEPRGVLARRAERAELTNWALPETTLVHQLLAAASRFPDRPALRAHDGRTLNHREFVERARAVAGSLAAVGLRRGGLCAVMMDRGPEQVIAAFGVMLTGAAYVPVNPQQPPERLAAILSSPRIGFLLSDQEPWERWYENGVRVIGFEEARRGSGELSLPRPRPQDPAYVIYTSGTTGVPKGVEISHGAAWNTIEVVNRRLGIRPYDRVLGVSAFDFDLSVYDAFGVLAAGGCLVTIADEARRDAVVWLDLVESCRITVWNSVPTLFEMLLTSAAGAPERLASLRHVLLSGDWIDVGLPSRMAELMPDGHILAMGGATEAAIWSNAIELTGAVPEDWVSIPYGRALEHQAYRVVDAEGRDCPDHVAGELWIGGLGVATGYVDDPELTAKKFVDAEGSRWYRTGDLGCFWQDGTIEFLGRSDNQIKLRGHRIELGEVEAACEALLPVTRAVCVPVRGSASSSLVVFVQPEQPLAPDGPESGGALETEAEDVGRIDVDAVLAPVLADQELCAALAHDEAVQCGYAMETMRRWTAQLICRRLSADDRLVALKRSWAHWLADRDAVTAVLPSEAERAELDRFVRPFGRAFVEAAQAESLAEFVQRPEVVPVEEFLSGRAVGRLTHAAIREIVRALGQADEAGMRVFELGARRLRESREYAQASGSSSYTMADYSPYYLDRMDESEPGSFGRMLFTTVGKPAPVSAAERFDLAICNQSVHQSTDVDASLRRIHALLAEQGLLLLVEPISSTPLAEVSAAFLSVQYSDARQGSGEMLLDAQAWREALEGADFRLLSSIGLTESLMLFLAVRAGGAEPVPVPPQEYEEAVRVLSARLPEYMLPKRIMRLGEFPLTANGKVDQRALVGLLTPESFQDEPTAAKSEVELSATEEALIGIWEELLDVDAGTDSDYFRLGGDSLVATRLRKRIEERFDVDFGLDIVFDSPVLKDMAARIDSLAARTGSGDELPAIVHAEDQYAPFPLTEVQQSYLIGASGAVELGEVSSHCYFEMATARLDLARLEDSFNALVERHPMLRAVVCEDGLSQRFLPQVPRYRIAHVQGQGLPGTQRVERIRQEMSRQRFDPTQWPCFDVRYAGTGEGEGRLFLSFDNVFIDGWSMFHVFREWKEFYEAGPASYAGRTPAYSFKDYVEAMERLRASEAYQQDLDYWEDRLDRIHPAPQLPVSQPDGDFSSAFVRHSALVEPAAWQAVKEGLRQEGLTEAAFLAEVYAETLARYSEEPGLSINLTQFERTPFAPEVDAIVGDFTSLSILSVDTRSGASFSQRARALQRRMWRNLAHSHVSGVSVERMLNRQRRSQITMPVVFTCGLGVVERDASTSPYLGVIDYGLSQTPQVWMDLQVYEDDGGLVLNLDAVEALFPEQMVDGIFRSLVQAVESLAKGFAAQPLSWGQETVTVCPSLNRDGIAALNRTGVLSEDSGPGDGTQTLLGLFDEGLRDHGGRTAVIDSERELSYTELDEESERWARLIAAESPEPGSLVAILLPKSTHQISAVLGVFKAGCAYLPLDPTHPVARNSRILTDAGVGIVLVKDRQGLPEPIGRGRAVIELADVMGGFSPVSSPAAPIGSGPAADGLAYVIYTSGTTGVPKGVAIAHRAVVNTIRDVNARLGAGPQDRVLALSELNFDLSVYDVFGMLACGGAIVMPSLQGLRDPAHWWELTCSHQVSLWNSVPSLFSMYAGHLADRGLVDEHLRAVLLSGDWIPVDVALRMADSFRDCRAYGLGGATEASIWSNWYPISVADAQRPSIPYGKPLANQRMYVLDDALEDRPELVPGDLYIAGRGLALGYWKDPVRTGQSFLRHPRTGERLYRTGDQAMYGRDGQIVFLGRRDGQVKVGGYRIELGEIESAALTVPGLRECVAVVTRAGVSERTASTTRASERTGNVELYVVVESEDVLGLVEGRLAQRLPQYMRPRRIVPLAELPRTWNGKVDRDSLEAQSQESFMAPTGPRNERDARLVAMWSRLLDSDEPGIDDDFFRLGGDSLAAVHLVNAIRKEISVEISIRDVFALPTVRQLSDHIEASVGADVEEGEI